MKSLSVRYVVMFMKVKKLLNSVLSVKFQEVNSKNWLKPKVL